VLQWFITCVCSNPLNILGRFSTDMPVLIREKRTRNYRVLVARKFNPIRDQTHPRGYHIKLGMDAHWLF